MWCFCRTAVEASRHGFVLDCSINELVCHGVPSSTRVLRREYCGHGIGREMHEAPQVLHYGKAGTGLVFSGLCARGLISRSSQPWRQPRCRDQVQHQMRVFLI